ncbi:MAG: SO_0444 family Cu/Zn efflux transporter [Planctomycetota bacterium JB042]
MIAFLADWLEAIWFILVESGPYLLAGFLIAGFIKRLVPEEKVFRHLGKDDFRSVFIASACGVPIPLCSCSVIPTAIALRRSGASKGATTSFLISTPETGVDSIGVTWALMDPIMTVARPFAALLTALGCGSLVNLLAPKDDPSAPAADAAEAEACCAHEGGDLEHHHVHDDETVVREGGVVRGAVRYAFGPLMADLTPWFILGFLVSGLITLLVPDDLFRQAGLPIWAQMIAMLLVAVPTYVCATASTPVAAALIAKGLDPGAAIVFLLAGPATSVTSWMVVRNFLGGRVFAIYLSGIAVSAVVIGYLVSALYGVLDLQPLSGSGAEEETTFFGAVKVAAGAALAALLLWYTVKDRLLARFGAWLRVWSAPLGVDPTSGPSKGLLAALLVLLWASTSLTVVRSGEVGFRTRFGGVVETIDAPRLVVHLPWPVESVDVVRDEEVRGVELGFRSERVAPGLDERNVAAEAEVLTGNENLLSINYTVHFVVRDAYRYRYAVDDPETLVRAFTESSIRRMTAHRSSDPLLIEDRSELEDETLGILQDDLDRVDAGVRVTKVNLIDIHSPSQTHWAYRDVASQLEYKEREILRAEADRVRRVTGARARAFALEQKALADAFQTTERARGDVAAVVSLRGAHRESPGPTEFLLRMRSMAEAFRDVRLVLPLSPEIRVIPTSGRPGVPRRAEEEE